jgi:serine phosphatase RsbU (regulator of sigma subunit)
MAKNVFRAIIYGIIILGAVFISSQNYLLFHVAIESFGITIIAAMFVIAFSTYHFSQNHFFMFLAISFGFIGIFSFVHTLTYKGMAIFPGVDANIPTQLYIVTKYLTGISLVFSFRYLNKKLSMSKVVIVYGITSLILFLSIFYWGIFPNCFIEGHGLTPFKIYSEYFNIFILIIVLGLLKKYKNSFHSKVYNNLVYSTIAGILAGLSFTFYVDVYGLSNMLGHIFQLSSYYFIFRGVVETSLKKPYDFLFLNLSKANEDLQKMNQQLTDYNTEIEVQQKELAMAYAKVNEDIEKAGKIHANFLPKVLPKVKDFSMAYYYKPALDLGGDFLNVQLLEDKLLIYLVDVSGHGLDGAILNIFIKENISKYLLISKYENKALLPSHVLNFLLAQYTKEDFPDEYYVCMLVGVLDIPTNKLFFSNAGMHISPFILNGRGDLSRLDVPGFPILSAFNMGVEPYSDVSLNLPQEFTLLLTTDGLVEEMNNGDIYSEERLTDVLLANHRESAEGLVQAIKTDFKNFSGGGRSKDDVTYLVVKREGISNRSNGKNKK